MYQKRYRNQRPFRDKPELPPGYLSSGYFDSKGNILEEYITKWPESIASKLQPMKKHQLRKFYHHVKAVERKLALINDYDFVNADLKKLIPLVESGSSRETVKIPPLFVKFIRTNMKNVSDKKTFKAFLEHFQALVCFCEKYLRD